LALKTMGCFYHVPRLTKTGFAMIMASALASKPKF
jgi:hypothetical protein